MRGAHAPTALFCANDIQALGALFACQRLGISVPASLSLMGFDDLPMIRVTNPPLSTVHVPADEMGAAAANALMSAVDTGRPIRSQSLDATIVMRASIAPPSP